MKIWLGVKRATPAERQSSRRGLLKINAAGVVLFSVFFAWAAYRRNLSGEILSGLFVLLYGLGVMAAWWRVRRHENEQVELWKENPFLRE